MKRWLRILLIAVGVLLLIVLVGPFLVPVPPLEGTLPPEQLADPDSRFVEVDGIRIHYKTMGAGEPTLVLLHGFGASVFSWREVMAPLAQEGRVVAFDRPAFGLTERPMPGEWTGENPYSREAQAAQTVGLMDALGIEQAVLVGNSAGGSIAVLTALRYPERVRALVLVDAAIYGEGGAPGWLRPLLDTPQVRHLGPLLVHSIQARGEEGIRLAWHDPARVTPEILEGYHKPLQAQNWDRALWEFTRASRPLDLPDRLGEITIPVLVITGDDDRIVPPELSERLAQDLPNAQLVVIPDCGHLPHEEQPEEFLRAVREFLAEIGD
jgi:pimeloyl-ACP methyl ester carboxylesterase